MIYAIDPGNKLSALCVIDPETLRPKLAMKGPNDELVKFIYDTTFTEDDVACIENLECFGMPVGREVIDTAIFIGRLTEILHRRLRNPPTYVFRSEEKLHICNSRRAKDANIRAALIARFAQHDSRNGKGTKSNPDWFYGFRADMWAAYAIGVTFAETKYKQD